MNINIEKINGTEKLTYSFLAFEFTFMLVNHTKEEKLKGKRKWTIKGYWNKYDERGATCYEPDLTDELREEVRLQAIDLIKVRTWTEWKHSRI